MVGAAGAVRGHAPRPGPQGALLRPGVLPSSRPSCSGPGSGRWRAGSRRSRGPRTSSSTRSSTSRSWSCAPVTMTRGAGVPERLPPPRGQARRGPGDAEERIHLPVPRMVLRRRRAATPSSPSAARSPSTTSNLPTRTSSPSAREVWGGCVWINFDADAPPLRTYLEPIAGILDAWKVASLRTEWWYACRIPANWKLVAGGLRRAVPRARDPSPAAHPRPVPAPQGPTLRPQGLRRRGAPVPADDVRGHGRHGPRRRRAHRRGHARHRAPGRPRGGGVGVEPAP